MLNDSDWAAIDEINAATWVEESIRKRALSKIMEGELGTEKILNSFRQIAERHRPAQPLPQPQLVKA